MKRGDYERAAKWLEFGEEKIPFREYETDWSIPTLYAYRYARVESFDNAANLAGFIKDQIMHWMEWDLRELDELERKREQLESEEREARARARTDRQRQLRNRIERLDNNRNELMNEISYYVSYLTILQRVFFLADLDERAEELAMEVNLMTEGRIPMPSTREENREQIDRFNLGI